MILDRLTLILVASVCLAGCAASPSLAPDYIGRYAGIDAASDSAVPAGSALASLPASAGSVLSVRNTTFSNGLRQVIVLEGPPAMTGENRIVVEALTPPRADVASGNELRLAPPSDAEIQSELAKLFPGVAMQISTDVEHGPQGPFGHATGKTGGLTCLYAWEYLAPRRPLSLLEGASGTGFYPVSVRVRLCRAEPLATLLSDMHRLTVTPPGRSGAVARMTPVTDTAGEDALEAAVGPMERLPVAEAASEERRERRHIRAARTGTRPHRFARPRRSLDLDTPALGRSTVPPVPLPGDLAAGAVAPAVTRPEPAPPPRIDQEPMPLPK